MNRQKAAICASIFVLVACAPPQSELGSSHYSASINRACAGMSLPGPTGHTDGELSVLGIRFNVRTPSNYDADVAHPLLMVFSPGDRDAFATERFTGLTTAFTAAGLVVAYADNRPRRIPSIRRPISEQWILELGTIPALISGRWCIDSERIYLTGHSNGGTVATALAVLPDSQVQPAAIAPSGAGFDADALAGFDCPTVPLSVLVMHSRDDNLFPGFGRQAVEWWAQCNGCNVKPVPDADGCQSYADCTNNAVTRYCPGMGQHRKWPNRMQTILDFFDRSG